MDNSTNTMTRLKEFGAWSEQTSSSGKRYYYNQDTEVSQWEKPIEWKEHEKNLLEKYKSSKSSAKSGSQQQRPSTSGSGNGAGASITNNSNLVSGKYFASPTSTSLKLSSANNSFSTPQSSTSAQKTSLKRPREDDRQHHYHASKNSCLQTTPITAHQSACGSDGHHIQNNFSVAKTLGASVNNVTVSSHHRSSGNFNSRFSSTSSTLPFIQNGNSSVFVAPKVLTTGVSASTPNTNSAFGVHGVQSFGGAIPTLSLSRNTVSPGSALGYQQHVPSSSTVKLQNNSSKSSSSRQSRVFNETSMKLCTSTSARLTETTKMSSLHYTMASSTNNTSTSSSKFTTTQSGIDRSLSQQNTPTIAETSVPISNGKNLTTPSTLLRSLAMDPKQRQDQTPSSSTCQMSSSPIAKTREVPIFDEKKYLKFYRVELTLHRRNWSSDSYTSEARKFADRNTKQLATLSAVDDDIRSVYSLLKAAEMRCMLLSQKLSFVRQQISSLETKNPSSI